MITVQISDKAHERLGRLLAANQSKIVKILFKGLG